MFESNSTEFQQCTIQYSGGREICLERVAGGCRHTKHRVVWS